MRHKILLVDDDEGFLSMCRAFLERADFEVIEAHDGEEALPLAFKERPCALVLDVAMPKKDGFTVTKEVRQTSWGKNIPIIILTAKDPDEGRLKEIDESAPTYYFVKGKDQFDDIISKIQEVILEQEHH